MSRLIPICERGSFISLPFPHRWNSQRFLECYCSKDERNPPTSAMRHLALITKTNDLFLPCQLCSLMFKPQSFFGHLSGWTDWAWCSGVKGLMNVLPEGSSFLLRILPEVCSWRLFLKVLPEVSRHSVDVLSQQHSWEAEDQRDFARSKAQKPPSSHLTEKTDGKTAERFTWQRCDEKWTDGGKERENTGMNKADGDRWVREWPTAPQQPNICWSGLTSERRRGPLSPARPSPWS